MVRIDKKRALIRSMIYVFSILLAFGCAEIVMRSMSMSSGTGRGKAGQRWLTENWKPINSLNYRDYEPSGGSEGDSVLFVGNSFTAGYGVKFEETFYYVAKMLLHQRYQSFNLGRAGVSTKGELDNYVEFIKK